jgi:3',5'-cyclic AMP phosphodiesterase CpdA
VRLHVLSDLHLERAPFTAPEVQADVVVLAGDIAPGTAGVDWTRSWLGDRPALYVAGNHEFYGQSFTELTDDLRARAGGSGIRIMENDASVIGGVRFLGCSLWSDFAFAGPERREYSMSVCERMVNDYSQIRASGSDGRLRAQDTLARHLESRAWLAQRLGERHDGPTVVITHHAPLVRERPDNPLLAAIAGAFASDLTALMGTDAVNLWIFGHIHRTVDVDVNGTRVISNQRGYPAEPVSGFDPSLVVDL